MEYLGTMENFIDMAGGESGHKKRKWYGFYVIFF